MSRQILTRSKTREYEAFFHEDIQQFKMMPPKGSKRKLKDQPYEEPESKRTFDGFYGNQVPMMQTMNCNSHPMTDTMMETD